jgi:hypothetical protein
MDLPGRPWTQPISACALRTRLAGMGMSTRTAALLQLAVDLPAAVLARCLAAGRRRRLARLRRPRHQRMRCTQLGVLGVRDLRQTTHETLAVRSAGRFVEE